MNFKLTHKLPKECFVAVSGGVDSMSALHWLMQVNNRVKGVVHFDHNTGEFSEKSKKLVEAFSMAKAIPFYVKKNNGVLEEGQSLEDFWRQNRYNWFKEISSANGDIPVILAHTLDDCLEEYVMCSMVRGFYGTIPYAHGPCIRPFRMLEKGKIRDYAKKYNIPHVEDPTNEHDWKFKRAYIRKNIVPNLKTLNPGIYNMVKKAIKEQDNKN